jgi:hypothetical protein
MSVPIGTAKFLCYVVFVMNIFIIIKVRFTKSGITLFLFLIVIVNQNWDVITMDICVWHYYSYNMICNHLNHANSWSYKNSSFAFVDVPIKLCLIYVNQGEITLLKKWRYYYNTDVHKVKLIIWWISLTYSTRYQHTYDIIWYDICLLREYCTNTNTHIFRLRYILVHDCIYAHIVKVMIISYDITFIHILSKWWQFHMILHLYTYCQSGDNFIWYYIYTHIVRYHYI